MATDVDYANEYRRAEAAEKRVRKLEEALKRICDHDKIILGEHMDEVRQIAREALE